MIQAVGDNSRGNLSRAPATSQLPPHLHRTGNGPAGTGRQSGRKVDRHQVVLGSPDRHGAMEASRSGMDVRNATSLVKVLQRVTQFVPPFLFCRSGSLSCFFYIHEDANTRTLS